jgi:ACT domain-containing protein
MERSRENASLNLPVFKLRLDVVSEDAARALAEELEKQGTTLYLNVAATIVIVLMVGVTEGDLQETIKLIRVRPDVKNVEVMESALEPFICAPRTQVPAEERGSDAVACDKHTCCHP